MSWLESLINKSQQAAGRTTPSNSSQQRAREQQAVLDALRSGGAVTGARPANPIIGMLQNLTGVGAGAVPNLYAAQLGGQEVLLGKGGWNQTTAATGPINVGGRTWYPAQKGKDLVYRPATKAGQYGSILPGDQVASVEPGKTPPGAQPPAASPAAKLSPEELAYNRERSRIAQLTEQNPEFQNIGQLRNNLRDQGMAIWAAKYGGPDGLASKVKPGQSGYETIQKTLYPGGAPLPAMSAESEAMLNAIAPPDATGVRPNVTPMPGQLPAFGNASEAMFQAVTGGGAYITPMPKEAVTPQTQAQDLAEAYRQAMLARIPTNK